MSEGRVPSTAGTPAGDKTSREPGPGSAGCPFHVGQRPHSRGLSVAVGAPPEHSGARTICDEGESTPQTNRY